ncbi:MAG: membrane protein insertion efficiency factor, partial [Chloroflexi bacterium]
TCSHYALVAIKSYGIGRATWLATKRLARSNPFTEAGYDMGR